MRRIGICLFAVLLMASLSACPADSGTENGGPRGGNGGGADIHKGNGHDGGTDNHKDNGHDGTSTPPKPIIGPKPVTGFAAAYKKALAADEGAADKAFGEAARLVGKAELARLLADAANTDKSASARKVALKILARVKNLADKPDVAKAVKPLLNDKEIDVRVAAAWVLLEGGYDKRLPTVVFKLAGGLMEKNKALDQILENPAVPYDEFCANALLAELSEQNAAFHKKLLRAMVEIGLESEQLGKALIKQYNTSDRQGKAQTIQLMARYAAKAPSAVQSLKDLYVDAQPAERDRIVDALKDLGDTKVLAKVFDKRLFSKERDKDLREKIVDVLLQSHDKAVVDVLNRVLEDNVFSTARPDHPSTVEKAADGLKKIATKRSVSVLIKALRHPERDISLASYASLQEITGHDIDFSPSSPQSPRQIAAWEKWWEENRSTFTSIED